MSSSSFYNLNNGGTPPTPSDNVSANPGEQSGSSFYQVDNPTPEKLESAQDILDDAQAAADAAAASAAAAEAAAAGAGSGLVVGSVFVKLPVRVATTGNITLSGLQTIDGVLVEEGDRVLVRGQSVTSENGIYEASSGAWARASDLDQDAEAQGSVVHVLEGTVYGDRVFCGVTDLVLEDTPSYGYYHSQLSASTTWTINHNLGFKPVISLFTMGSVEFDAQITHTSDNQAVVSIESSIAGFARCV